MHFIVLLPDRCFEVDPEHLDYYREHALAIYEVEKIHKNDYHYIRKGRTAGHKRIWAFLVNEELFEKFGPKPGPRWNPPKESTSERG